jgi:hypothetical protein
MTLLYQRVGNECDARYEELAEYNEQGVNGEEGCRLI